MNSQKKVIESQLSGESITRKIYFIRNHKVMLDFDLSALYEVETNYLKRQVRRNIERFPEDFLFELNSEEYKSLRSQFGILKEASIQNINHLLSPNKVWQCSAESLTPGKLCR